MFGVKFSSIFNTFTSCIYRSKSFINSAKRLLLITMQIFNLFLNLLIYNILYLNEDNIVNY